MALIFQGCGSSSDDTSAANGAPSTKDSPDLIVSVEGASNGSWVPVFDRVPWDGLAYVSRLSGTMDVGLKGIKYPSDEKYRIDDRGLTQGYKARRHDGMPLTVSKTTMISGFSGVLLQDWLVPFSDAPIFGVVFRITRGADSDFIVIPDRNKVPSEDKSRQFMYAINPIRLREGDRFFLGHNFPVRGYFAGQFPCSPATIQYSIKFESQKTNHPAQTSAHEIPLPTPGKGHASKREPLERFGLPHVWIPPRNEFESGFWIGETEFTRGAAKMWLEGERYRWEQDGRDELESEEEREKAWEKHSRYFLPDSRHLTDDRSPAVAGYDIAVRMCQALGGRLPYSHEWRWAASGGDESKKFPWGDEHAINRRSAENGARIGNKKGTALVGMFPPNRFGLYDVIGNAAEYSVELWQSSSGETEEVIQSRGFIGRGYDRSFVATIHHFFDRPVGDCAFRCVIEPE